MIFVKLLKNTSRSYKSCKSFYSQGFLIEKPVIPKPILCTACPSVDAFTLLKF